MEGIDLIVMRDAQSPAAEAYRSIRTNIQFLRTQQELKTILVTSSLPGEGKSAAAASLAVVMAQAGQKVLLMDCNLRKPALHAIFRLNDRGLVDALAGAADAAALVQPSGVENLDVLAAGAAVANPSELLGSERMAQIIGQMKSRYDTVLIDTPPVIPATDAAVLAARSDGVIMVVGAGMVPPDAAAEAKQRLLRGGARILGAVLNKTEATRANSSVYPQ